MAKRYSDNIIFKSLNAFSYGYFITIAISVILKQLGSLTSISELTSWGNTVYDLLTPVIAVAIAYALDMHGLGMLCALIVGTISHDNPLTAYLCIMLTMILVKYIEGRTPIDIFLIPSLSILLSGLIVKFVGPYITIFIKWYASLISIGLDKQPILMGIIVSILMGIASLTPITTITIGSLIKLNGVGAGIALAGVSAHMLSLAVISIGDNDIGDVLAIGLGTGMLQFTNIIKNPIIEVIPVISSIASGIISALIGIKSTAQGAMLGMCGAIGLTDTISVMGNGYWLILILVDIILPMIISLLLYRFFRKIDLIKHGELKLTRI